MASRFNSARNLAQRLITKNGRPVSLQRKSGVPADPNVPWGPDAAPTTVSNIPGVFFDYTREDRQNSLIQAGDKRCLVAKLDLETFIPQVNDLIVEEDGSTWNIVNILTVEPGLKTDAIMYELQLRA